MIVKLKKIFYSFKKLTLNFFIKNSSVFYFIFNPIMNKKNVTCLSIDNTNNNLEPKKYNYKHSQTQHTLTIGKEKLQISVVFII